MHSIVSVRSNIKSSRFWEVHLEPKTVLRGQPFSGKSSIVEAITLGLRGHGDDVVFAKPKTAQGLLSLIGPGQSELVSELTFDDGTKAVFAFKAKGKGSFSRPDHTLPGWLQGVTGTLPLHDIQAKITGDPARAMDAFLLAAEVMAGVDKAKRSLLDKLSKQGGEAFAEMFEGETPAGKAPDDGIRWLAWVREVASRRKLDADAAARTFEASSTALVTFDQTVTAEEVVTARHELAWQEARIPALLWELGQAWAAIPPETEGEEVEEAPELSEEDALLADQYAEAVTECECIQAFLTAAKALSEHYAYRLPYEVGAVQEWDAYLSGLGDWMKDVEPSLKRPAASAETAPVTRDALLEAYSAIYDKVTAALEPFGKTLEDVEIPETELEAVDLNALRMELARKEVLLKQQAEKGKDKGKGKTKRADAAAFKEVADAAEEALAELVVANKTRLEERVSRFLPKTDRCVIDTSAHGVDGLFMPYIKHANNLGGPAFSGYEGNMLLMALAGATVPATAPFACLIPSDRDRGYDLLDMMKTWSASPFQVIITTNSAHVPELSPWRQLVIERGQLQ